MVQMSSINKQTDINGSLRVFNESVALRLSPTVVDCEVAVTYCRQNMLEVKFEAKE